MEKHLDTFENQVLQIAALGAWHMTSGKPMIKRLVPVSDNRWEEKLPLFVTFKRNGKICGSMGVIESSNSLPETLFEVGGNAATHDSRYEAMSESDLCEASIEVSLLVDFKTIKDPSEIEIGRHGIFISRGDAQAVILPHIPAQMKWTANEFLEASCEKAGLSHKAWQDGNTLIEIFSCLDYRSENVLSLISQFVAQNSH